PHLPLHEGEESLWGGRLNPSIPTELRRLFSIIHRAAASSKNQVTPLPWCEAICAGYFFGSYSSWKTARTASALSSPATTNTVCLAASSAPGSRVTRHW